MSTDSRGSAAEGVLGAGRIAWALVGVGVALAIVGWVCWKIAIIFPPLILAGAIVFLLNPIVTRLNARGVPRPLCVGFTYLTFIAVVVGVGFIVAPAIGRQGEDLSDQWPEIRKDTEDWVDDLAKRFEGTPLEFDREQITDAITSSDQSVRQQIDRAGEWGIKVFHVLLILILAPVFAFYLLVDLPHLRRTAEGLIPEPLRDDVMVVARRINQAVGGFFRGQLAVAVIVGVMASIGLWIIGLRFWLLIGMIAGMFNMIPLVGPYIGGIPGVLIALTTAEPVTALLVVVVMVVVQQIDNHFISPVVMHRLVKLHPVVVMLSLLLGGTLLGFFGLVVAVPTAAVLKIIIGHVWRVHILGEPLEQWNAEFSAQMEAPGVGIVGQVPTDD